MAQRLLHVYIHTGISWPAETVITFRFQLPDGSEIPIEGSGTVVWTERMGFGVRLDQLATSDRDRIKGFVESEQSLGGGHLAAMGL